MITKQQILDSISSKVVAIGDIAALQAAAVSAGDKGPKLSEIPRPEGGRIETWDVPVVVTTNADGDHTRKATQTITVIYNGDNTEAGATLSGNIQENYVEPAAEVDSKKSAFTGLIAQYGAANVAFSGVEKFEGLDVGIFTLFAGTENEAKIGITIFEGDAAPTIVPYFPKA